MKTVEIPGFVDEIKRSVEEAFMGMFGQRVTPAPGRVENAVAVPSDVAGVIKVFQDEHECTISIAFPKETILGILSNVYGRPVTEVNSSVQQGVGEIANVVYIMAKGRLNNRGFKFKIAIPELKTDIGQLHVRQESGSDVLMPVETNAGGFNIVLGFTPTTTAA